MTKHESMVLLAFMDKYFRPPQVANRSYSDYVTLTDNSENRQLLADAERTWGEPLKYRIEQGHIITYEWAIMVYLKKKFEQEAGL